MFDLFSNFKWVRSNGFFGEPLWGKRRTLHNINTNTQHNTHQTHTTTTNNTTPQSTPQTPHALPHTTQHNITRRKRIAKERQRENKGRKKRKNTCFHVFFLHVMAMVPLTFHNVSIFCFSLQFQKLFHTLSNVNI